MKPLVYTVLKAVSALGDGCNGSISKAHSFSKSARSRGWQLTMERK